MSKKEIRNVLITGASKGIGYATAKRFLTSDESFNLILVARKSEKFDAAIEELNSLNPTKGQSITQFEADFGNLHDVNKLLTYIEEREISLDMLVNNAGYTNPNGFLDTDPDDFRHTLEINLIAPFHLIRELYHQGNHLQQIVNIASTAGMGARPGWLSYAASKSAMISMSDTLREELKVFGTDVICLSPGRCATDLRKTLAPDEDPTTIMQPENVADIIYFMSTDAARYIDSQNIVVRQ